MRQLCLLFMTACTSKPPSCATPLDDFCSRSKCDRTLADAEHDTSLCIGIPATEASCDVYTVVLKTEIDTRIGWYYRNGQLVAIASLGPDDPGCTAGPESFDMPGCSLAQTTPLPACLD